MAILDRWLVIVLEGTPRLWTESGRRSPPLPILMFGASFRENPSWSATSVFLRECRRKCSGQVAFLCPWSQINTNRDWTREVLRQRLFRPARTWSSCGAALPREPNRSPLPRLLGRIADGRDDLAPLARHCSEPFVHTISGLLSPLRSRGSRRGLPDAPAGAGVQPTIAADRDACSFP